jgi:uncharacterized protein involved in exopolysaccharide biosynthesis
MNLNAEARASRSPVDWIGQFIDLLRRRFWTMVIVFVLITAGVVGGIYIKRPSFVSAAKVIVNTEARQVSLSRADVVVGAAHVLAAEAVTSQVEVLRSRELIETLLDDLGMETFKDPLPDNVVLRFLVLAIDRVSQTVTSALQYVMLLDKISPRDALVERIEKALDVYAVRQAQVIVIGFRWHTAHIPPLVLGKLLDLYLDKVADINSQPESYGFYLEQAGKAKQDLDLAEAALGELKNRHRFTDLEREKALLLERVETLSGLVDGTPLRVSGAGAAGDSQGASETLGAPQLSALRSQLAGLRIELAKTRISYKPGHRQVRELQSQIAAVEQTIAGEMDQLEGKLASYRERLHALESVHTEFNRATRNLELATVAYETYRRVAEDRRVVQAQSPKVLTRIFDPPSRPLRPEGPSRLILLLAGILFAAITAVAAVLAIDWLQLRGRRTRWQESHWDRATLHDPQGPLPPERREMVRS